MKAEKANNVYDILVNIGDASERERESFIYHHTNEDDVCNEWRFQGKLGFGGKYRESKNSVDCYREDLNPEREKIIEKINQELAAL